MGIREEGHWIYEDYSQRMTRKQWKEILLNGQDIIIYKGRLTRLIAKNLGCGIVEVRKGKPVVEEK